MSLDEYLRGGYTLTESVEMEAERRGCDPGYCNPRKAQEYEEMRREMLAAPPLAPAPVEEET
jgi:hypothetical protein